jgi:hypothetical protein
MKLINRPLYTEREFGNLMKIEDNYSKYVVTLNDALIGNDKEGIIQINLMDFLVHDLL